jgi:alkylation response protein AidB-like acyl-CoA dehydrogenase
MRSLPLIGTELQHPLARAAKGAVTDFASVAVVTPQRLWESAISEARTGRLASLSMAEMATAPLYELPPEYLDFRDTICRMAAEQLGPRAAAIDASGEYPWDIRELLAAHDVLALPFELEHGGTGTGTLMLNMVIEEIAKVCASSALILMLQELGTLPIRLFGTDKQKQAWLPRCASGEWAPAFALSEPEAGSDPSALRTSAVRDGDEWVINGTKSWISNAGVADFYIVFAVTDREQRRSTAFVVESDRPGFSVAKLEHKLGIRGSPTGSPVLEDVRVPDEHRIGDVDRGLGVALATLERSRLGAAAQAVGLAQGATDFATGYAIDRIAFGQPLIDIGAIQHKLANMATRTAAARELLYRACAMADRCAPGLGKYSSMAKLFASDVAMEVTVEAVQVLGGYGYVTEYPLERMMRDAKITQIYEGTNEIQRVVIARALKREATGHPEAPV